MAIDIKEVLSIPKEHRQALQEIIGYSIVNEMNLKVFNSEQKKLIEQRIKKYCEKRGALFKFEEIKSLVPDKL